MPKFITNCDDGRVKIPRSNLFFSSSYGNLDLSFDRGSSKFFVNDYGKDNLVPNYELSKELRNITCELLLMYLQSGYIHIRKSESHYALEFKGRLLGGGPVAGAIAYWATKTLCYGTAVAGATTLVVTTGGAAMGAATGAAAAGATAGASTGGAVVGGAIAGAGGAEGAAALTAAVVGAEGVAGTVAAVESASLGAGAFFTAIPFLP